MEDESLIIRVANFLKSAPPFSFFSDIHLQEIANTTSISVSNQGEVVFKQGQPAEKSFYVIKKGAIDLLQEKDEIAILIDRCEEGSMFGLRSLLDLHHIFSAKCNEDTILYEVSVDTFKAIYPLYPEAVKYIAKYFAVNLGKVVIETSQTKDSLKSTMIENMFIKSKDRPEAIFVADTVSIKDAVASMNKHGISSIIITNTKKFPVGIITDRDLRKCFLSKYDEHISVKEIMNSPVKCVPDNMLVYDIQLEMLENKINHLCVTQDGTDQSEVISVLTLSDVLFSHSASPLIIYKKIKKSQTLHEIKEARKKIDTFLYSFVHDDIKKSFSLSIIGKLNQYLIAKVIECSLEQYNSTNDKPIDKETFSFYCTGSTGRGEQLQMTDQDNGLLFSDDLKSRKEDYLKLASIIVKNLCYIGYERCPANMMASNIKWCKTVTEMIAIVEDWMRNPDYDKVIMTSIFFDAKHFFGKEKYLQKILDFVVKLAPKSDLFLRFLAKGSVSFPPPLSFFRKFIVEKDGEHSDEFDIKLRGIASLVGLARVLTLKDGWLKSSSTIKRFEYLEQKDTPNAKLYRQAIEAYLELLSFRLKYALEHASNGRYIKPEKLTKEEKLMLRDAFEPTKILIGMVDRMFRLAYL